MEDFIYIFENKQTLANHQNMSDKLVKLNQKNLNILLIDDILKADSLNLMLNHYSGYQISFYAANNREALNILRNNQIHLIISDIQHPDGGLYDLHKKLVADPVFSQIPVVVFSDYPMYFEGELTMVWKEIFDLDYKYYLEKEAINEQLISLIDKAYIENYFILNALYQYQKQPE